MPRLNHAPVVIAALLILVCAGCGDSEPAGDGSGSTAGSDDEKSIEFENWKAEASELCASASSRLDTLAEATPARDATDEEIVKLMRDYVGVVDELRADLTALGTPTSSSPSMSDAVQKRASSFIDSVGRLAATTSELLTSSGSSVEADNEVFYAAFDEFAAAATQIDVACDLNSPVNRGTSSPMADCRIDRETLETAASAFEASTGTRAQSMDDLIRSGFLGKPLPGWQLIDGEVVVVAGSDCAE